MFSFFYGKINWDFNVENLTSLILKELKQYKIGIDMKESLLILKDKKVIDEARLLRNRISYRYKEPSRVQLIEFIDKNSNLFDKILNVAKRYLINNSYIKNFL